MIKTITLPVGIPNIDLSKLLVEIGACSSRSMAKRLIEQKTVSLDGVVVSDKIVDLPPEDPVIKCGKRFFRKLMMPRKTFKVDVDEEAGIAKILEEVKDVKVS